MYECLSFSLSLSTNTFGLPSENIASRFGNLTRANNFRIILHVLAPDLFNVLFCLHLECVLSNFISLHVWQTGIFNQYARSQIVFNNIQLYQTSSFSSSQNPTPLISFNNIINNFPLRMHHNNSIVVPRNLIIMNQQILLSFNNKNTFTFALLDIVKFNLTLT